MNKVLRFLLSLIFSAFLLSGLRTPDSGLLYADTAGSAGEIFYYGQGARAMGMGRAFTAVSDDANSTYWNMAGMGLLPQQQVTASQSTLLEGVSYNYLGYVYPFVNRNALGMSVNMLSTPSVVKRDVNNVMNGSFSFQKIGIAPHTASR